MQQPRNFSLYGAVDLGARQAAAQRAQQASRAGGPGEAQDGAVIEVTEETFNTEVVERSRRVPVILDLWAEWCGPCKQLSPVLEKLATEAAGAWVLAKVDVEANPRLGAALQVQSIPMVVAVIQGELADGFLGAMPEPQVREWIDRVMQVAEQLGIVPEGTAQPGSATGGAAEEGAGPAAGGPGAPQGPEERGPGQGGPGYPGARQRPPDGPGGDPYGDPAFEEARQAMERGDLDGAAAAFERVLAATPGHPVATLGLAQVNLIRRVNGYDEARERREAAASPDDVDAQCRVADIDVATGRIEEGFDRLLGVVRRTAGDERDQARKHLVSLFEIFPPRDSRVSKARATLSSLLF